MSKKINIQELAEKIGKKSFLDYYKKHTNSETLKYFNLTMQKTLFNLLDYYDIKKHDSNESYNLRDAKMVSMRLDNYINRISKDAILDKYKDLGLGKTAQYFHISQSNLKKLMKYYSIEILDKKDSYKKRSEKINKIYFEKLLDKISREDLTQIYMDGGISKVSSFYHISDKNAWILLKYFNINRLRKHRTYISKASKYANSLPRDLVQSTYLKYNGNKTKCHDELKISINQLNRILKKLNIEKIDPYDDEHLKNIVSKDALELLYEKQRLPKTRIREILKISPKTLDRLIIIYHLSRPSGLFPSTSNSKPNLSFEQLLIDNNIKYEREFRLYNVKVKNNYKHYQYDFKINNLLIEINPSVTHNITRGIRNGQAPVKDKYYHKRKSMFAAEHGYICICIWDWIDKSDIINKIKYNYYDNCSVKFAAPRKYIYDLKKGKIVIEENDDTLTIYDDGILYI